MISVVIPTITGRRAVYEQCVAAYKETAAGMVEIITVRDEKSCGRAWQVGAELATGDYLHFTADDLAPQPGWAEAAIGAADRGVLPAANVMNPSGPLVCPAPLGPRYADGPNVLVPFFSRDVFNLGRWLVPIHYGSDDWITYLAARRDIPVEFVEEYRFTHSAAEEGRLWMNRATDVPKLATYMESEGYVPPAYASIAGSFGWAGWVG